MDKAVTEQEICLQQFTVTLGGEMVQVHEKSIRENAEFRQHIAALVSRAFDRFAPEIRGSLESDDDSEGVDVAGLIGRGLPFLLTDGFDYMAGLVEAYDPALKPYVAGASDEEVMEAAGEVLERALPLVVATVKRMLAVLKKIMQALPRD